eukprot:jgi/Bigna1/67312/fgenesh1_pg.3_\
MAPPFVSEGVKTVRALVELIKMETTMREMKNQQVSNSRNEWESSLLDVLFESALMINDMFSCWESKMYHSVVQNVEARCWAVREKLTALERILPPRLYSKMLVSPNSNKWKFCDVALTSYKIILQAPKKQTIPLFDERCSDVVLPRFHRFNFHVAENRTGICVLSGKSPVLYLRPTKCLKNLDPSSWMIFNKCGGFKLSRATRSSLRSEQMFDVLTSSKKGDNLLSGKISDRYSRTISESDSTRRMSGVISVQENVTLSPRIDRTRKTASQDNDGHDSVGQKPRSGDLISKHAEVFEHIPPLGDAAELEEDLKALINQEDDGPNELQKSDPSSSTRQLYVLPPKQAKASIKIFHVHTRKRSSSHPIQPKPSLSKDNAESGGFSKFKQIFLDRHLYVRRPCEMPSSSKSHDSLLRDRTRSLDNSIQRRGELRFGGIGRRFKLLGSRGDDAEIYVGADATQRRNGRPGDYSIHSDLVMIRIINKTFRFCFASEDDFSSFLRLFDWFTHVEPSRFVFESLLLRIRLSQSYSVLDMTPSPVSKGRLCMTEIFEVMYEAMLRDMAMFSASIESRSRSPRSRSSAPTRANNDKKRVRRTESGKRAQVIENIHINKLYRTRNFNQNNNEEEECDRARLLLQLLTRGCVKRGDIVRDDPLEHRVNVDVEEGIDTRSSMCMKIAWALSSYNLSTSECKCHTHLTARPSPACESDSISMQSKLSGTITIFQVEKMARDPGIRKQMLDVMFEIMILGHKMSLHNSSAEIGQFHPDVACPSMLPVLLATLSRVSRSLQAVYLGKLLMLIKTSRNRTKLFLEQYCWQNWLFPLMLNAMPTHCIDDSSEDKDNSEKPRPEQVRAEIPEDKNKLVLRKVPRSSRVQQGKVAPIFASTRAASAKRNKKGLAEYERCLKLVVSILAHVHAYEIVNFTDPTSCPSSPELPPMKIKKKSTSSQGDNVSHLLGLEVTRTMLLFRQYLPWTEATRSVFSMILASTALMIKNLEPVIKKERFLAVEQKKGKGGIFGWLGSSNKQHIPTATKDILHFMILVGMFVFEFQVKKDNAQIHAQELIFYNGYQVDSEGKSIDIGLIEATVEA